MNQLMNTKMVENLSLPHLHGCTEVITEGSALKGLRVHIDTQHHKYLHDHTFGGDCFVPATQIIELFCETAKWLSTSLESPHLEISHVRNLNIERAIAIEPGKALTIEIGLTRQVKSDTETIYELAITSDRVNKVGKILGKRVNASARVIVTSRIQKPESLLLPEMNFTQFSFPSNEFYRFYSPSHGVQFQSITGNFSVSDNKEYIYGEYDCGAKEQDYIEGQQSIFMTSPLGYDSCLQYMVFLSRLQRVFGSLPVGAKDITILSKHPTEGPCRVLVRRVTMDDTYMEADIIAADSTGQVVMKAERFRVKKAKFHTTHREEFFQFLEKHRVDKCA
ncbi:MAG: hypothetical protein HOK97_15640 [Deltaproteobacteria bacterium]|jgi:hypothetical protein|nr:hypothetical protein [Deltaproteobacteria bacterium]MBT6491204.1 hypothetical protein [Deltaproteobacteria bacterium]